MKKNIKIVIIMIFLVVGSGVIYGILKTSNFNQLFSSDQPTDHYNIVDYGAKADRPSFDNAEIFNEIIGEMDENGGTIYIPTGDFFIDSPIKIDRSYVSIIGENSG